MRNVFRLSYVLVSFLLLISAEAFPQDLSPKRAPASTVATKKINLSDLSPLDSLTQTRQPLMSSQMRVASDMKSVTPPLGRGMGVQAPIFRFR